MIEAVMDVEGFLSSVQTWRTLHHKLNQDLRPASLRSWIIHESWWVNYNIPPCPPHVTPSSLWRAEGFMMRRDHMERHVGKGLMLLTDKTWDLFFYRPDVEIFFKWDNSLCRWAFSNKTPGDGFHVCVGGCAGPSCATVLQCWLSSSREPSSFSSLKQRRVQQQMEDGC